MKIAIIGAGNMGGAIVEGLLKGNIVANQDIAVADPSAKKLEKFAAQGACVYADNCQAVQGADVVMVVVKPWLAESVLKGIKDSLNYEKQLLVTVIASVNAASISQWMDKDGNVLPFFQVIPNIAIAQMASMSFIVPNGATQQQTQTISDIFGSMGEVMVTEERLLGAGTTLASCGIAYVMRYIRAATEGGVELGFYAADAQRIIMQTMLGAVRLLEANGSHPEQEIDKVTTPGGLTIKGLNAMEENGFTNSVIKGLKAGI